MDRVEVSKEYVRQQLHAMGVRELSEADLESYTRDFSRLIHEHLQKESPTGTISGESFYSTNSSCLASGHESLTEQAPCRPGRHSAIFKTFPGDKENRVYPLPASTTPSPLRVPPTTPHTVTTTATGNEKRLESDKTTTVTRKRKVLRKVNGESRVFEESYSSVGASSSVESIGSDLSNLSLTSSTSSESNSPRQDGTSFCHSVTHRSQCKSFIRPTTAQLYTRRLKKHDPVTRYHEWKEIWQNEKFPGEDSRSALRWQIREQMMQQDLPFFVPPRRPVKVNNYVVPTDKKRLALRWDIRHQMAHQ